MHLPREYRRGDDWRQAIGSVEHEVKPTHTQSVLLRHFGPKPVRGRFPTVVVAQSDPYRSRSRNKFVGGRQPDRAGSKASKGNSRQESVARFRSNEELIALGA